MKRLSWLNSIVMDGSGYSAVGQQLRQTVNAAGAKIVPEFDLDWDALVIVGIPAPWPFRNGKYRSDIVWHTMIEVEPLPSGWVDILNRVGLVWTPSRWVAEQFRRGGVRAPIRVAGYGVEPTFFHDRERPAHSKMRFGVWTDTFKTRKHAEMSIEAYLAAGLTDATLEVKVNDTTIGPYWIGQDGRMHSDIPIFRGVWSEAKLSSWLRSLDCLIYLSGGEGFGLIPLEAMACGTVVIGAYNTGMMDYLNDANCIPIRQHTTEAAPSYTHRFGDGYHPLQLRPDFDEAVAAIRWASEQRESEALCSIQTEAAATGRKWTWQAAGQAAWEMLREYMEAT